MSPIAFDGQFGWLHGPRGTMADTGVVLVPPIGRDARCAHLPMRLFASRLAEAGFPVLRYDHRGEGDSLPLPEPEADALPVWLDGIDVAIETLRTRTAARRIVLAGVRLGASLAALKAARADGLILLGPVLNGGSWLRRMRFSASQAAAAPADGAIDAEGLWLSAATVAGLSAIDLPPAPAPRAPAFVAAQNRMVAAFAGRLPDAAAHGFPGFETLFLDAHSNEPPEELFKAAGDWLTARFGPRRRPALTLAGGGDEAVQHPPGASERAVRFGEGLNGVLCQPRTPLPDAPAVIFCNTGGDPRAGIGGFATTAARTLARRGAISLRFDFAGLGDSPAAGGAARSHVFETDRRADLKAAVSLLAAEGHRRIAVVGVCAGAFHVLNAATLDTRVTDVFAVSPVELTWTVGDSLAPGRRDDGKATHVYLSALKDPATWRRLLAGGIDVPAVARTLALRLKARSQTRGARPDAASPLATLGAFAERGGRAHMLMGLDDASLDEVGLHLGPRGAKLKRFPGVTLKVDPDLDHGLARRKSREAALHELAQWLGLGSPQVQ